MKKSSNHYEVYPFDKLPNVVLMGNGITWSEETKWTNVIASLSNDNSVLSEKIPYTIQATVKLDKYDKDRNDKYYDYFNNRYVYKNFPLIEEIIGLDFDAFLTTNYTYEIENTILNDFYKFSDEKKIKYIEHAKSKANSKYIINDYYQLKYEGKNKNIWHIHGEARKKNSLILNHDEYGHLVERIISENSEYGSKTILDGRYKYKSWIDYILFSNLFILGQGFDFSEFDLWWILNRRFKENKRRTGKIIYYTPKDANTDVSEAMMALGVDVRNFDMLANDNNYKLFYKRALEDIRIELK